MKAVKEKKGLGGWLILVGFGIFSSIVVLGLESMVIPELVTVIPQWFDHSLMAGMLWSAFASLTVCFLAYELFIAYLFFSKKRSFTAHFQLSYLLGIVYALLSWFLLTNYLPENIEAFRGVMQSIIACIVWCAYIRKSERVKNTFVN